MHGHDQVSHLTPSLGRELADMVAAIDDGQCVAMAPDYSGCAMAIVAELIRAGRRGLCLLGVPQLGLSADLLIGAGCVAEVEAAAVSLGEYGPAPRFAAAAKTTEIAVRDSTCPVIHAGLQAAEKGIPFIPLRGILGSDLVTHRPDWHVIDNPLSADAGNEPGSDPILVVPAIQPDVAVFHAPFADHDGNVWIGVRRELMLMAHAAKKTLVTVERIEERSLLHDQELAAGTIPSLYIDQITVIPDGAWPMGLFTAYPADHKALSEYASSATSEDGFDGFLMQFLDHFA